MNILEALHQRQDAVASQADEFRLAQELPHVGTLQPQPGPAGGVSDAAAPGMPKHPQVTTVLRSYCFIG